MQHTMENEFLIVTADTFGAELVGVVDKATGAQLLWQADPAVWGRHAPILFPYCGRLKDGCYRLDGQQYTGGQHGFARDMEHDFRPSEPGSLCFVLESSQQTLQKLPRAFRFTTRYILEGRTVRHQVTVQNLDAKPLRFGLGYHPAFALPFDDQHTTQDYELRFDAPQTPVVIETGADTGLVTGETRVLMEQQAAIALEDRMFDNDSICMSQLNAKSLSLVEKDTGRCITVGLEGFPYTLIWSAAGQAQLQFVCIEPWHSLPDTTTANGDWLQKPCAAQLEAGQSWTTHLDMTFNR